MFIWFPAWWWTGVNVDTACIVIIFMEKIDEDSSKRIHPPVMRIGGMGVSSWEVICFVHPVVAVDQSVAWLRLNVVFGDSIGAELV